MFITASHANLLARLPQEHQATAYEQCWRKDWSDKEPHLLPAKHLAAWIQTNLYLSLADAPLSKEDTTLNPIAGACITCPRRSGFNSTQFADVQGDQCLDAPCFRTKVNAHIDREIAAHPGLVQIEDGWRKPSEVRPEAVQRGHFREVESAVDNPDAEPVTACPAAKAAIIVFEKRVGMHITVCTDNNCSVHDDPRAATRRAANPAPVMAPSAPVETEEEAQQRRADYDNQQRQYEAAQERQNEERRQQFQREHEEMEAEAAKRDEVRKQREATFERIVANAPATLTAPQLRVILRAIVNLDPYTFADDLAEQIADENDNRSAEEVLLTVIDGTADDKLTGFAVHLALAGHRAIPREGEADFLTEAEAAFAPKAPKQTSSSRKHKQPTPIKPKADTTKPRKATPAKAIANKKKAA